MFSPTLTNLQLEVHVGAELDDNVPSSSDTDYAVRTHLLNKWIRNWENEKGMHWNELWKEGSITSTGAASYALSSYSMSDFRFSGGYIYVTQAQGGSYYIPVIKLDDIELKKNEIGTYCYFLGDPANGFTIYFNPNSKPSTGDTIKVPYYKGATQLSSGSDKTEVGDCDYLVHGVISDILAQEDPAESDRQFQIAQDKMAGMKARNLMTPPFMPNGVEDRYAKLTGKGFGV